MIEDPRRDPDLDDGLASERTALAWTRTAFAVAATGAVAFRVPQRLAALRVVAALLVLAGIGVWAVGRARLRSSERALRQGRPLAAPRVVGFVAAVVTAASVAALAISALAPPKP